jgi:phospholipase C
MQWWRAFAGFLGAALLFGLLGCGGGGGSKASSVVTPAAEQPAASTRTAIGPIQHIVLMLQENRSFDTYFGKLNDYRAARGLPANVDGLPANASNPGVNGKPVAAFKLQTTCTENMVADWDSAHYDLNLANPTSGQPLMNGFVTQAAKFAQSLGLNDTAGVRAMGFYDADYLPFYYFMATAFATSDRWFSPALTRTQPARLFLLSATSAGHTSVPTAPLTNKTIFQLLEENGVSWKVYVTDYSPDAKSSGTYMRYFVDFYNAHLSHFVPVSQYLADVQNNTLPSVALIESGYEVGEDEHPDNNMQVGAQYAASLINALMQSPSWANSVFFLTFDEGGGAYDHVPPAAAVSPDGIKPIDLAAGDVPGDFTATGFRVPLIVISPYTRPHYVSHTPADYTALLKFVETQFGLPPLTKRDAAQPDISEFFDFAKAPYAAPPVPPEQPVMPSSYCYMNHLP